MTNYKQFGGVIDCDDELSKLLNTVYGIKIIKISGCGLRLAYHSTL